jgi:hypothetical protein
MSYGLPEKLRAGMPPKRRSIERSRNTSAMIPHRAPPLLRTLGVLYPRGVSFAVGCRSWERYLKDASARQVFRPKDGGPEPLSTL